jgi:hypothetical protein
MKLRSTVPLGLGEAREFRESLRGSLRPLRPRMLSSVEPGPSAEVDECIEFA